MQIEVMIDEAVSKNLHLGKTRDEIIMSYQHEENITEFSDDEEPFVDTTRTDLEEDLQAEKVKTKNLEALVLTLITRVQKLETR